MALLEAWAVQALLRTPAFHRAVEKIAKNVHRVRHGLPREEEGGTRIEGQESGRDGFTKHFMGAVKGQLGAAEEAEAERARPQSYYEQLRKGRSDGSKVVEEEEDMDGTDAEAAWRRASRKLEAKVKVKGEGSQKVHVSEEDADAAWRG
jgi:hypothetical protein